jgi:hypothetical protein
MGRVGARQEAQGEDHDESGDDEEQPAGVHGSPEKKRTFSWISVSLTRRNMVFLFSRTEMI